MRHKLYLYMEEPTSSRVAFILNGFLLSCNIISNITYWLESIPVVGDDDGVSSGGVWYGWEIFLMTVFTLELMLRIPARTSIQEFVFNRPEILLDCVACIPFDFYLFFGIHLSILDTRWIRPLRLLRVVQLGGRLVSDLRLILEGLRKSTSLMFLMWCLIILVLFSFASVLFMAERGQWDSVHQCYVDKFLRCATFDSVPSSLYFTLEVVSSLGYGDLVPESTIGRWITMILMIFSVAILALTVTVFSIRFSGVYKWVSRDMSISALREASDLTVRLRRFDETCSTTDDFLDASCRLVTGVEILQAIGNDLQRVCKCMRADLIFLSEQGLEGAVKHNRRIGTSSKSLSALTEKIVANLAAHAYNDIDSLTNFVLCTSADMFADGVGTVIK
jgi:voltage-gated potassium channel